MKLFQTIYLNKYFSIRKTIYLPQDCKQKTNTNLIKQAGAEPTLEDQAKQPQKASFSVCPLCTFPGLHCTGYVHWFAQAICTGLHKLFAPGCTGYMHWVAKEICTGLHRLCSLGCTFYLLKLAQATLACTGYV